MAAIRRAECVWEGDLASGSGVVSAATSQAFAGLAVTWRRARSRRTAERVPRS